MISQNERKRQIMVQNNTPKDRRSWDEEFAFDLTPDLRDGRHTLPHPRRAAVPQGSHAEESRADDVPHNGRKGGEY